MSIIDTNIASPVREISTFEQITANLHRPALMAPMATRLDCFRCPYVVNDDDGVAESCDRLIGEPCIRHDRRSPWGMR